MVDEAAQAGPKRTPLTDEVLRRVGRNLVVFQCVENALKFLAVHAGIHAPMSQFADRFDKHSESISKTTMGGLAGKLMDTVLTRDDRNAAPDDVDEIWIGFRFMIETDAESAARHERELKDLVDRRNELVHHFLPRWHAAVGGDAESALSWLDEQREAAAAMLERLEGWVRTVDAARHKYAAFVASGEMARQMELMLLRSSRLVVMLGQVAMATTRADGWTSLPSAIHLIKREAAEELDDLSKRFGYSTPEAVLRAAGLFDVSEEKTPRGTRTIYRINSQWRLEIPLACLTVAKTGDR